MILDTFSHAWRYSALHPLLRTAFDFLADPALAMRPCGRYELDGSRLYVSIEEYDTKPLSQAVLEAHRRYLDIQTLVSGTEQVGWAPLAGQPVRTPYDEARDIAFYDGEFAPHLLVPGRWMLLFPQDAHAPQIALDKPVRVRKAVAKILL
ncbi:MAG: YhcH/YjgK/YiaL family protein [Kiritimatiellia bacterium]